jgi:hypothetical protein
MKLTWTCGFRYHQISFLSGPASPPSGLGHSTVWQTSQMARQFPVTPFFVHDTVFGSESVHFSPTATSHSCGSLSSQPIDTIAGYAEPLRRIVRFSAVFSEN